MVKRKKYKIIDLLFKPFNVFTPKLKNSIYLCIDLTSKNNFEDIFNNGGNNTLKFLNGLINKKFKEKLNVFVEYFDDERIEEYKALSSKVKENNINLVFVRDYADKKGIERIKRLLAIYHHLFRSKIWTVGTGDTYIFGKLKKQQLIDLNYFITCKNDLVVGDNWRFKHINRYLTSSLLHSTASAAQTGVRLDNCIELGFPRNDTLFDTDKRDKITQWISAEIGYNPKKIIVYAPTYRDYEKGVANLSQRFLFGYDLPELEEYLLKNQYCLICKLHNLQNRSILEYPKGVINFKLCYDFSFYDLMGVADSVITDYSSLGYDYMLLNKPLIYNLYDLNKYIIDRGLSYYPYEEFCPGAIVTNAEEMMKELDLLSKGIDSNKEKRERLIKIFHKYPDNGSTERLIEYFAKEYGLIYEQN